MSDEAMKILELSAKNVKRIKAVHLTVGPEGGLVVIGGKNDQGKTSVLDSFMYALGGGKTIPDKPLREGADRGEVEVTLNGSGDKQYHVTRTFTASGSYLTVEDADGREFKSPQSMLDEFLGELSFDPLAFARMSAKDQREALLDSTGLREELAEQEEQIEEVYEERRDARRDLKRLESKLEGEEKPDAPDEEQSQQEIVKALRDARQKKQSNDEKRRKLQQARETLDDYQGDVAQIDDRIEELRKELNRLQGEREKVSENAESQKKKVLALENEVEELEDPDIEALESQLEDIEDINKRVRERQRIERLERQVVDQQEKVDKHERKLEKLRAEREEAIQAADMPLDDLSVTSDGVTYEGYPFEQLSSSKQLKVSIAMAMAMNPALRVLRIEDGSLLDDDSLEQLRSMAEEHDYHIWIERVGEDGPVKAIIEDGEIKETTNE